MLVASYNPGYPEHPENAETLDPAAVPGAGIRLSRTRPRGRDRRPRKRPRPRPRDRAGAAGGQDPRPQGRDLEEGVSTRLVVYAASLIRQGMGVDRAIEAAMIEPLTDDATPSAACATLRPRSLAGGRAWADLEPWEPEETVGKTGTSGPAALTRRRISPIRRSRCPRLRAASRCCFAALAAPHGRDQARRRPDIASPYRLAAQAGDRHAETVPRPVSTARCCACPNGCRCCRPGEWRALPVAGGLRGP